MEKRSEEILYHGFVPEGFDFMSLFQTTSIIEEQTSSAEAGGNVVSEVRANDKQSPDVNDESEVTASGRESPLEIADSLSVLARAKDNQPDVEGLSRVPGPGIKIQKKTLSAMVHFNLDSDCLLVFGDQPLKSILEKKSKAIVDELYGRVAVVREIEPVTASEPRDGADQQVAPAKKRKARSIAVANRPNYRRIRKDQTKRLFDAYKVGV